MRSISDVQLEKLIDDISSIKDVLANSRSSIQLLFLPVHFRLIFVLSGISILLFSAVYYALTGMYGSYSEIPRLYRCTILVAIFVDGLALGLLKNINWIRSLSHINSKYNFRKAYLEFFNFRIIHSYLLIGTTMAVFIAYWIIIGSPYLIIPTVCIGTGILGNFTGNMTGIVEYTIFGCWTLIWGFIIIMAETIPAPVALSCSLGAGMLIFAAFSYFTKPLPEE